MVRHGWRVSVRAGAKRHMPSLHTARPHMQSHRPAPQRQ